MRYNEQLGRNGARRGRIDGLRRERMLFEDLGAKLARGLERQKGEMVEVIGRIAEAHEAREKVGAVGEGVGVSSGVQAVGEVVPGAVW